MRLTFIRRQLLAPGIWQHYFKPERRLDFVPGQYIDVRLSTAGRAAGGAASRTFTITSQPLEEFVSFVTKDFDPVSDYKQQLHGLQPGDNATATDAMGDMVLPMDCSIPLLFVASGIAVASFVSMIEASRLQHDNRAITLLYSVRYPNQLIFSDIWKAPAVQASKIFISPQRLTARDVMAAASSDSLIYLSGSEHFVEDLRHQLQAQGIAAGRIIFDFYEGYPEQQI